MLFFPLSWYPVHCDLSGVSKGLSVVIAYHFPEQPEGGKKKREKKNLKEDMLQRQLVSWENFVGRSYLLVGVCWGCEDGGGCSQSTDVILRLQQFLVLCGPPSSSPL